MKKKLLIIVALFGAMTLGSCVSDSESSSVEAVRNAKAEQLNSVAALNAAKAAAEKALADANATLINAQAEAQKVENQRAAVEVELLKVKVDEEKAKLELQLAQLEQQKAEIANQIKLAAAQLDANLAQIQLELMNAQNAILELNKSIATTQNNYISNLSAQYTNSIVQLTNLKNNLLNSKRNLVLAQTDLENVTASVNNQITIWEGWIAEQNNQIAIYKAQGSASQAEIKTDRDAAYQAYQVKLAGLKPLAVAQSAASTAFSTAFNNLSKDELNTLQYSWTAQGWVNKAIDTSKELVYEGENGVSYSTNYNEESSFTIDENEYQIKLAAAKAAIVTPKADLQTAQTAYDAAKKAYDEAFAAWQKDATTTKLSAYEAAKTALNAAKTNLTTAQTTYDNFNEELTDLQNAYAAITNKDKLAAYNTSLKAYNEASLANAQATKNYNLADASVQMAYSKWYALLTTYNTLGDNNDLATAITNCENIIKQYNQNIADLKNHGTLTQEEAIATLTAQIAAIESQITVQEALVAKYKAALDAAMK